KEIKRDVEVAIIQNTTYNAGATATARQTRGLAGWIKQGSVGADTGVFPVPTTNTAPVAGTARAWSETLLKDMAQDAYTAGGEPTLLVVRPADKALTSAFAGNATNFNKAEGSAIHASYDWYVSDFGKFKIVPDRFCDAAAYLIDLEHVSFGTLDPLSRSPLAKTGDAEKMLLTMEYALIMDNCDAHAVARDLS
ncbi:SU10 major capsid protein, partial [Stutzerimonas kunmingensis]|uniref:SU10 major capsid protein n=1 Tax=Stutzerimonas kunmingensis TaxID=1211807 RepID=UPI002FC9814E